jgi:hypothetical protein
MTLRNVGFLLFAASLLICTNLEAAPVVECEYYPTVAGIAFSDAGAQSAADAAVEACERHDCFSVCVDYANDHPECEEAYNPTGPYCDAAQEFFYDPSQPLWGYGSEGYCECFMFI